MVRKRLRAATGLVVVLALGGCTSSEPRDAAARPPAAASAAGAPASEAAPSEAVRSFPVPARPAWTRARTLHYARFRLHLAVTESELSAIERRADVAPAVSRAQATAAARRFSGADGPRVGAEMFVGNDIDHAPRLLWLVVLGTYGDDVISRFHLPASANPMFGAIDAVPVDAETGVAWWADSR